MILKPIVRANMRQLVFVVMAFSLMVVTCIFFTGRIVQGEIVANAEEVMTTAESNINSLLKEAQAMMLAASVSLQGQLRDNAPREQIVGYLAECVSSLREHPGYVSEFVDIYGYFDGKFFSGINWVPGESYFLEERPWYKAAMLDPGNVAFTLPPFDMKTRDIILSASKVLFDPDGNRFGVVALDMKMTRIVNLIKSLQFTKGGYGMLIDDNFNIVAHPDGSIVGTLMDEVSATHSWLAKRLRSGENAISSVKMENSFGQTVIVFYRKLQNGWYVGIATPMMGYYRDVYLMTAILLFLGFLFMTILSYFLLRLSLAKEHSDEENRSKSSFLARMSHEIRTPMNAIMGMAELISRKPVSVDVREYISIIQHSGNTLLAIINDILDFSKLDTDLMKLESKEYFLSSLVNDTINVIRPRLTEKNLDFLVNVNCNIPSRLVGDDVRVRQILTNLLSNAVKYTPDGLVSLDVQMNMTHDRKLELIFKVRDSGVGIKEEDMDKLFVNFSRLDNSSNHSIEGTGLGLAITMTLCKLMSGNVTVSSEFGVGSTFTATVIQNYNECPKFASVEGSGRKRVLLLEERPLYMESLMDSMRQLGVSPVCASNLEEFINGLKYGNYDFAFVQSKYAMDCVDELGELWNSVRLVVMVDLGEVSEFKGLHSVLMPIYSSPIANILNGVSVNEYGANRGRFPMFLIPGVKVLVVDDISSNLRVARELISQYDADVETCESGREAVRLVRENHYDIVFMDHMMPDMDGIEAVSLIRGTSDADGYFGRLPIIALTANAVSGQREIFLKNGMNDFLPKPIDMHCLDNILKKWTPHGKQIPRLLSPDHTEPETYGDNISIRGVDAAWGLKNTGNSMKIYKDILGSFCLDAAVREPAIKKTVDDENIKLYTILVHAIKGASEVIGAFECAALAGQLEEAAISGNISLMKGGTETLLEVMRSLRANISAALANELPQNESAIGSEKNVAVELQLEVLKAALIEMDIATVNDLMVKYTKMRLDSQTKNIIFNVEQHVLMFEYEDAIKDIDALLDFVK